MWIGNGSCTHGNACLFQHSEELRGTGRKGSGKGKRNHSQSRKGGKGGGGRPDMAQAGGPDGDKAKAAISAIEAELSAGT